MSKIYKSITDCDCPIGYYKCHYMKYCVPQDRKDMCPKYNYRNCSEINNNYDYYIDGICRNKNYMQPSQRVCPIGKILCPDLSCEDNYYNCKIYDILHDGKTRCVDQNITQNAYECQSTITCSHPDKVVCPDGECVINEIFCKNMKECPIDFPFLCKKSNKCVKSFELCEIDKYYCGDGLSLCEDYICRENCGNIDYINVSYVIEKCILSEKNNSFEAGNYYNFTLELRTEKGLLYNGDFDINNDIFIEIINFDKSFNYSISKADYGIYIITIYSHLKGNNTMKVLLKDQKSEETIKRDFDLAYYYVYPQNIPSKTNTIIKNEKIINLTEIIDFEILFILADKYNNTFEGRNDLIDNNYLTLINNIDNNINNSISEAILSLNNENVYKYTVSPKSSLKTMKLNVLYNDGKNVVFCFKEDIIVNIIISLDFNQTILVSKNKERIYAGEYLDLKLYTFDRIGKCYDDKTNYSSYFKIKVTGPIDSVNPQKSVDYSVYKTMRGMEEECNNEYEIIEKDKYQYAGNYIIEIYANDQLIDRFEQVCLPQNYSLFFLE